MGELPFSRDTFLDVFAAYNSLLWPMALAMWLATAAAFAACVAGQGRPRFTLGLLAVQWAWAGAVYHAALFSRINPAAWGFAALFVVEACLLAWWSLGPSPRTFRRERSFQQLAGYVLVTYGLLYPFMALAGGESYPRLPTFGVPCPATIVTVGFLLLMSQRLPRALLVIPLLWTVVGGSAAVLLDMRPDVGLWPAGLALALQLLRRPGRSGGGLRSALDSGSRSR